MSELQICPRHRWCVKLDLESIDNGVSTRACNPLVIFLKGAFAYRTVSVLRRYFVALGFEDSLKLKSQKNLVSTFFWSTQETSQFIELFDFSEIPRSTTVWMVLKPL